MKIIAVLSTGWIPVVWAQVAGSTGDTSGLLTGSAVTILGTAVIAFVRRWVVSGVSYDRLEVKYDAAIEELRKRNEDDRKEFIPMMVRFTDVASILLDAQKERP